jgi:glycosyltransferase involved in cell wall biosynthesis
MRVLFALHDFLPGHPSGSEIHTAELAVHLRQRGHDVRVFATEKDITRRHLSLGRRTWNGIVVHELVNNLFYRDFRETWDFPPAEAALEEVLGEFRPDVVHFMHLLYLSAGCVERASARGIPVFFTLHDYWLQCARFGQLVHADGSICERVDFARCGTCLARLKYAQTPLERRVARGVALARSGLGIDLEPPLRSVQRMFARGVQRLLARGSRRPAPRADPALASTMERAMGERERELRRRVVPHVRRFFAPSRFLRERFVGWGIPPERIVHLPYGIDLERLGAAPLAEPAGSTPSTGSAEEPPLRIAFLGTLAPHKAPHLLLEAWSLLPAEARARARLTVYGPKHHHPEYVAALVARAAELAVAMPGPTDPREVARVFAEIDLLVLPSTWYENSPLTLLEARATRTPALVSDLGGMAELIADGRAGWTFRAGDAADLARHLARVIADPRQLDQLDFGAEPPRSIASTAEELEGHYRDALAARGERSA